MNVTMLLYPRLTQLDLTGPFEVMARYPELKLHLVWKNLDPVIDGNGLKIVPTHTFETCPPADIVFVPGGPGQIALMDDGQTLDFLRRQAEGARYVTSVCTGSLVLAAAGLLKGRKATSHWSSIDQLSLFGVEPVDERVVVDGNVVTGAGVTSGIDFALRLCAELFGAERARMTQLGMEYDPQPPFGDGSPKTTDAARLAQAKDAIRPFIEKRRKASEQAAARLG